MNNLLIRLAAAAALALAFACGSDSNDDVRPPDTQTVAVTGVGLDSNAIRMKAGARASLTANVWPSAATERGVGWVSDKPGVASVAGSGATVTVTAVATGTATITATTDEGGYTDTCRVVVEDDAVQAASLSIDTAAFGLVPGASGMIHARLVPSDADAQGVVWDSSNKAAATVAGSGLTAMVTGVANGSSMITASTPDGLSAACTVTVGPYSVPALDMVIPANLSFSRRAKNGATLSASMTPPNANPTFTWTSSDTGVARVAGTGATATLTAVGLGTCTVTATAQGITRTCDVTVNDDTLTPLTTMSSSYYHSIAMKADGTLVGWGWNDYGQMGNGTTTPSTNSTPVAAAQGGQAASLRWKCVSSGQEYSAGVTTEGALYTWGNGSSGKLGNGGTSNSTSPFKITNAGADDWKMVACGQLHTMAIKGDGELWGCGSLSNGRVGTGGTSGNQTTFARVAAGTKWMAVTCGDDFTVALDSEGAIWSWGNPANGRLGNGTTSGAVNTPAKLTTIEGGISNSDFAMVSAHNRGSHVLALHSSGRLYSWGAGENGRLGSNATAAITRPTQIAGTAANYNWKWISAGYQHSMAVRDDNTLWVCGQNSSGQLGLGNTSTGPSQFTQAGATVQSAWAGAVGGYNVGHAITPGGALYGAGVAGSTPGGIGTGAASSSLVSVGTAFKVPEPVI